MKSTLKMKRVLFVGADDSPGGVFGYISEIASNISVDKYEFHMTVSGGKTSAVTSTPLVTKHVIPHTYNIWSVASYAFKLRKIVVNNNINILHLHTARAGMVGCLAAIGLPVTVIYSGHSWRHEQKTSVIGKGVFKLYEKLICQCSDYVTFLTKRDLEYGINNKLLPKEKGFAISTRIDANKCRDTYYRMKNSIRSELGIRDGVIVIGNTGYMSARKDPLTFIKISSEISKSVPDARFLWVGDGELKNQALQLASLLGIKDKVLITGMVCPEEVPAYLAAIDIFVFTSHIEGVPLSILEAQACGIPVVSSDYIGSGVEELVQHKVTGFVFHRNDYIEASGYVTELINSSDIKNKVVENSKLEFEQHHSNPLIMAQEFERLYDNELYKKKSM